MRINASIDDSYQQKLMAIQQATDLDTTEIIKKALDLMYEKTRSMSREKSQNLPDTVHGFAEGSVSKDSAAFVENNKSGAKLRALLASDFIGCGSGPEDGSVHYEKYVADYLDDKYPT